MSMSMREEFSGELGSSRPEPGQRSVAFQARPVRGSTADNPEPRQRSVTFQEDETVHIIPRIPMMEKRRLFYSAGDYQKFETAYEFAKMLDKHTAIILRGT